MRVDTHILADFYRGRPLDDEEIAVVTTHYEWVTEEQREIALAVADALVPAEESFASQVEVPNRTRWATPGGVPVTVDFADQYSAMGGWSGPVESITIGDQTEGVSAELVGSILAAITGPTRGEVAS